MVQIEKNLEAVGITCKVSIQRKSKVNPGGLQVFSELVHHSPLEHNKLVNDKVSQHQHVTQQ